MNASNFSNLINVPDNDYMKGIDLSHHNQNIDWTSLINEGIKIAYIKITDGVGTRDPKARVFANEAKANSIRIGYYHFARPDKKNGGSLESDSQAEANEVLNTMSGLSAQDLPLVLDLEDSPPWDSPLNSDEYLRWVNNFIKIYNNKVIIYSRKNYLDQKLPVNHNLSTAIWLARYTNNFKQAVPPNGWNSWLGWQFCENGKIGSNNPMDLSLWHNSILSI